MRKAEILYKKIEAGDWLYWGLLFAVILCWIIFLVRLSSGGGLFFMALEEAPSVEFHREDFHRALPAENLWDTVTFMSGFSTAKPQSPLKKDRGQSMLVILNEPEPGQILSTFQASAHEESNGKGKNLIFFFGTGAEEKNFRENSRILLDERIARSSVYPWDRKPDFAVLPDFDDESVGGLLYLSAGYPDLPVFCPPFSKDALKRKFNKLNSIPHLIPLKKGFTRLSSRLWALVLPDGEEGFVLFMVIMGKKGPVVLSGSGKAGLLKPAMEVTARFGKAPVAIAGGTGLMYALAGKPLKDELSGLKKITGGVVSLYPNLNTSPVASEEMEKLFGPQLKETPLGGSFDIDNP